MSQYRDVGVVTRNIRLGESDRIVVILSRDHGMIRAVAKGVRKTKSRIGGRVEPMNQVSILCWAGKDLHTINQVEVIEPYGAIRSDLRKTASALAMLEAAEIASLEGRENSPLYEMTVKALTTLASNNSPMLFPAYLLKLLSLEGACPVTDVCALCRGDAQLVAFDLSEGGALCGECRRSARIDPVSLIAIRRVLNGELGAVLSEEFHQSVVNEVNHLAVQAVEYHYGRRMRSVKVLDRV